MRMTNVQVGEMPLGADVAVDIAIADAYVIINNSITHMGGQLRLLIF